MTTKNKPKIKVPCPHCGKPIYPAQMLGHIRHKKMSKEDLKKFTSQGGKASYKAKIARSKKK